jgi:hypothetical protein
MSEQIIQLLVAERDRLDRAIEALQGPAKVVDVYDDPTMPDWVKPKSKIAPTPAPKKKGFSAATRRKMAEGQKRRWAVINAAKVEPVAPKKRTMSAEGRQRIIDATKARWAKVRAAKVAAVAPKPTATVAPTSAPAKTPVVPKQKASTAKSAAFSKKMSEPMKKRKKTAKKKAA